MKQKPIDGEFIYLITDGDPSAFFVRGHVDPELARQTIYDEAGPDFVIADPVPWYARWSREPGPDGCVCVMREYAQPGRGRFKVMRATVLRIPSRRTRWRRNTAQARRGLPAGSALHLHRTGASGRTLPRSNAPSVLTRKVARRPRINRIGRPANSLTH